MPVKIWSASGRATNRGRPIKVGPPAVLRRGRQPYVFISVETLICLCVGKCRRRCDCKVWIIVPTEIPPGKRKKKKLRWFVNSSVGVCLGVFLSFSSSSLSSLPLSVFVPTLPHTRACLYVIVCRDLLRITDRKPIHQGYLRRVTLFVWSEIKTLPCAALSLSSSSLLPASKPPPTPHPLSLSGVTT